MTKSGISYSVRKNVQQLIVIKMETKIDVRPEISLLDEESYVRSICNLGFYFIKKYPKFFREILEKDTDQFELRVSSDNLDKIPFDEEMKNDADFIKTACMTMHVGWNSFQYDSHITVKIVKEPDISISFMHKIDWRDQVTIYFTDYSMGGIKLPGEKEQEYDPAVMSHLSEKWFKEVVGFTSERTTTIEKGLDSLEQVLQKLEDN